MASNVEATEPILQDGGLFEFDMERGWARSTDANGTQVFWQKGAGSGTLRVSSITAKKPFDSVELAVADLLASDTGIQTRSDGVGIAHCRKAASEGARNTVIFWWKAVQALPPKYLRIAYFSFTIFAEEERDPKTQRQIAFLTAALPSVRFGDLQEFEK
jgi:hypothetical protein